MKKIDRKIQKGIVFIAILIIFLFGIGAVIVGCGGGGGSDGGGVDPTSSPTTSPTTSPTASPTTSPIPSPTGTVVQSGTVNENGGTVEVNDPQSELNGVKVEVPEGAVAGDTDVEIMDYGMATNPPSGSIALSNQMKVQSTGTFQKPVYLEIPYNEGKIRPREGDESVVGVFAYNESDGSWNGQIVLDPENAGDSSIKVPVNPETDSILIVMGTDSLEKLTKKYSKGLNSFDYSKDGFYCNNPVDPQTGEPSCFGMTIFARWFYTNLPNPPGVHLYYRFEYPYSEEVAIDAMQILEQAYENYKTVGNLFSDDSKQKNRIKYYLFMEKKAVHLNIYRIDTTFPFLHGHSLLVYDIEEDSQEIKFMVYDPNWSKPPTKQWLAYNKQTKNFEKYESYSWNVFVGAMGKVSYYNGKMQQVYTQHQNDPVPGEPPTTYQFEKHWGGQGSGQGKFDGIFGIAVGPSGYIYVVDQLNFRIQKFDSNGTFIKEWGSRGNNEGQFQMPWKIACDSSGSVYVTDQGRDMVHKFDSDGKFITRWDADDAWGITTDKNGYVYVTCCGGEEWQESKVMKFDGEGNLKTSWGSSGTGDGEFGILYDIASDSSGNIYVVDHGNRRIQKFDSGGNFITKWSSRNPKNIGIDPWDRAFVTQDNNEIEVYDSNGNLVNVEISNSGSWQDLMDEPWGIVSDSSGNIYLAIPKNEVVMKFAPVQ